MRRPIAHSRQRGVALLIALVLMALAAILAVKVGFGDFIERKRATSLLAAEQAYQFAMGAEALAADALLNAHSQNKTQDTLADAWAQTPQPIPLRPPNDPEGEPMGVLEGFLQDEQGKFNINNLARRDAQGKPDPVPYEQFKRLLALLKLEDKWADLARDWIDADSDPSFPNGAEDAIYSSQNPPYRTANWPMLSTSELMSLPDFGAERYRRLQPFITALPANTPVNVCTAPGCVIDALSGNDEFCRNPDELIRGRKSGCFPRKTEVAAAPGIKKEDLDKSIVETTGYFKLTTRVTLGSAEFTLYSLLKREDNSGRSYPILRSFGTD